MSSWLSCTVGDAGNAVQTNLSKMRFHPDIYRANAYQGLIYDPMSTLIKNYQDIIIIIFATTHPQGQYQLGWTSLWRSALKERGREVDNESEDSRTHL